MTNLRLWALALSLSVPLAAYANWGAIAVDDERGERDPAYGVGGGASRGEAERNAMKFCRENSTRKCEVVVTYQQCGAYASSRNYYGKATAATEQAVKERALSECGQRSCKIIVADCN